MNYTYLSRVYCFSSTRIIRLLISCCLTFLHVVFATFSTNVGVKGVTILRDSSFIDNDSGPSGWTIDIKDSATILMRNLTLIDSNRSTGIFVARVQSFAVDSSFLSRCEPGLFIEGKSQWGFPRVSPWHHISLISDLYINLFILVRYQAHCCIQHWV